MTNALRFVVLSVNCIHTARLGQQRHHHSRRKGVALSVTGKGQVSQRTSFMVLISIVAMLLSAMALFRP